MAELPAIGSVVADKYRIEALLGEGGMGAVFRARHELMDSTVALKWLHPSLAKSPEAKERFLREARAAARIRHPHVVEVYDVGVHDGSLFMVMELLEGESFESVLGRGDISVPCALRLLVEAMRGVAAAHQRGIVHRDIKPENIFVICSPLHPDGTAKVLDFGISKLTDAKLSAQHLTQTGSTIGTPLYMSLEQMNGARDVDGRTDVYAFGVLLYRALTGQLPFTGETFAMIAVNVATHQPPSPRALRPELPEELDAVVMKAMSRDREQRYPTMRDLIDAVAPFAAYERETMPHPEPAKAHVALTSLIAGTRKEPLAELPILQSASHASESFQVPAHSARERLRPALVAGFAIVAGLAMALIWRASTAPSSVPTVPRPPPAPAARLPVSPASGLDEWVVEPVVPSLALSPEQAQDASTPAEALLVAPTEAKPAATSDAGRASRRKSGDEAKSSDERKLGSKAAPPPANVLPKLPAPELAPAKVESETAHGLRSGKMSRDEFR